MGNFINLFGRHFASVGHALQEQAVTAVHIILHGSRFSCVEAASHGSEIRRNIGFHHVEVQTEFVGQQFRGIGHHAKNADTASKRGFVGHNVVGTARQVVTARSSHAAHRHYHRLFSLELLHGAPHLFRGVCAAAARIDTEHHGFHALVFGQFVKVAHYLRAHNFALGAIQRALGRNIHNSSFGIVNGNVVARRSRHIEFCQFGGRYKVYLVLLAEFLQFGAHLVDIGQFVHHFQTHIVVGFGKRHIAVGKSVQAVGRNFARSRHILTEVLPNVADKRLNLLAVRFAHFGQDIGFNGALECAHFEHLHFHAHLFHQVGKENGLRSDTVPIEHTAGVQPHFVGSRSQIVRALSVLVGISHNKLFALFKVDQCLTEFFERGKVGAEQSAFEVDALDFIVGLGHFNGFEQIVESLRSQGFVSHQFGKGVFGCTFRHRAVQFNAQHAAIADRRLRIAGSHDGEKHNQAHDAHECRYADKAYDGG